MQKKKNNSKNSKLLYGFAFIIIIVFFVTLIIWVIITPVLFFDSVNCVNKSIKGINENMADKLNRLNKENMLKVDDWNWEVESKCSGLSNINECEKIEWPLNCGCRKAYKSDCYTCFAELERNPNYCEKIESPFSRNNCYVGVLNIFIEKGMEDKIDFCDKMLGGPEKDNMRDECFKIIQKANER